MNIQGWFSLGLTGWISLSVQGTLKSLFQYHRSKASILRCSASFMVQLSHPYMTTGKTIGSTRQSWQSDVSSFFFFPETDPISLFLGLLIYLLLHIGMNIESRGSQQSWPLSKSGASHKCIKRYIIFWPWVRPPDILWSFLSDNQKTFLPRVFFLKPGTTLQIKLHSYRVRV